MYPTLEEAKKIIATGDYKRIPVTMELNSDMVTPVMAVKRLKKVSHHCFMLESAEADKKIGGKDCLYDGKCGDVNVHKSFILSPFVIVLHGFPKVKITLIIKFM